MNRRILATVVAALALFAGVCQSDWTQFGYGADHTRSSTDTGIGKGNVGNLHAVWTATTGGAVLSSPAVANGVAYVGAADRLYAFDAAGSTGCSGTPTTCDPLWTADLGGGPSSPAVANGVVYVFRNSGVDSDPAALAAFDAAGPRVVRARPRRASRCGPPTSVVDSVRRRRWPTAWSMSALGTARSLRSTPPGRRIARARPSPVRRCGLRPPAIASSRRPRWRTASSTSAPSTPSSTCSTWSGAVLWTATTLGYVLSSPAVANGVVYVGSMDDKLYVFDAAGSTGCSGTPKTCEPLWMAETGGALSSSPAVANGVVYIGSGDKKLYAYDAATGAELWTAATGDDIESSPAVANGLVYIGSRDRLLYVFDAAGSTNCSGTPKTCAPIRRFATTIGINSSPAVAKGMVYVGSFDTKLYAFKP